MKQYKTKLVREMNDFTKKFILLFLLVFTMIMAMVIVGIQKIKVSHTKAAYTQILEGIFHEFDENLSFNAHNQNFTSFILDGKNREGVYQAYYRFQASAPVDCVLILANKEGQVLFVSNGEESEIGRYYATIFPKIKETEQEKKHLDIVRTSDKKASIVLSVPIKKAGEKIGYATYLYDAKSFHYKLSSLPYDGALVDTFNNVIAVSHSGYVEGALQRVDTRFSEKGYHIKGGRIFWVSRNRYNESIAVLSFVSISDYLWMYLIGFLLITLFLALLYWASKRSIHSMAQNNAKSITQLVEQMAIIKNGDLTCKMVLQTEDEFEMLSKDINFMAQAVEKISKREAALAFQNKMGEIKQLEAQFNPHFMYNTLETIRYAIDFEPEVASELIRKLTKILRYRISNQQGEVSFSEDLEVIQEYLAIQKYRYKERLNVIFDIQKECAHERVPRLFIQPLIENSIQNGFSRQTVLNIHVKATIEKGYLLVVVEDDGDGIEEEKLAKIRKILGSPHNESNHNGLFNLNRRIYLSRGMTCGIKISSVWQKGTRITIKLKIGGDGNVSRHGSGR